MSQRDNANTNAIQCLTFETASGNYLYDAGTNRIVLIPMDVRRVIESLQGGTSLSSGCKADAEALQGAHSLVKALQRQGLLCGVGISCPSVKEHWGCLAPMIRSGLSQVTLEITERCNLRCAYCIYVAHPESQRSHGQKDMDDDIADMAIDYFYSHCTNAHNISLGFYGGEPLCAYPAVVRATKVAQTYARGYETHLHITTNGTLLTREKFAFLVDHGFHILVSLDGPRSIHDQYRRTIDGKATFDRILGNLRALRRYDPHYYASNVGFAAVRSPRASLRELADFFSVNSLVRNAMFLVSDAHVECQTILQRLLNDVADPQGIRTDAQVLGQEFVTRVLTKRRRGARWGFLASVFGRAFVKLHRRTMHQGRGSPSWFNGMCVPGGRKLFVAANGSYYTCERVGRNAPIGHALTGVDDGLARAILQRQETFHTAHCRGCWAVRLCGACQSSLGAALDGDGEEASRFCAAERARLASMLEQYVAFLEMAPDALDYIEEIMIS